MKFTDSQIYFINDSIRRALREEEKFIKYWTDKAEKENNIQLKNSMRRSVEYAVQKLEELDDMMKKINEL